jgi:hypothetical protein
MCLIGGWIDGARYDGKLETIDVDFVNCDDAASDFKKSLV